jgi:predicted permease
MTSIGDALYRLMLRAFPSPFRRRHGERMLEQFQAQRASLRGRPVALAGLWLRIAVDALWHGLLLRREAGATARLGVAGAVVQDVRYAIRAFRRERGVTITIVAILTAGIAANAIMFGVVDQLLLRAPAGVGHADAVRRVHFGREGPPRPGQSIADRHSYVFIAAIRDNVPAFSAAAATSVAEVTLGAGGDARQATAQLVDASYFPLLELRAAEGRFFTRAEATETGAQPVVVLSHGFWRRAYGGDARVIGQQIRVEGMLLTIVGVGPSGFSGIEATPVDVWVPIGTLAPTVLGTRWASTPGRFAFGLVARLAPGATPELADAQATAAFRGVKTDMPIISDGTAVTAPLEGLGAPNGISTEGRVGFWLLGVSAVVLLIAVANVASLLLTRTLSHRREIAVCLALGVSRTRLLRQLLIQSGVLCAIAALAAVAVAYGGGHLVQQVLLPGFAWHEGVVDHRVLAVTLAIGTLTALGAGLAPALQALSTDLLSSLRTAPRTTGGRIGLVRTGLLVAQVALSVVLLVGAGLFVRSLRALRAHDVGIDLARVIQTLLPDRPTMSLADVEAMYAQAADRVSSIPGVELVTIARASTPMGISSATTTLREGWTLGDPPGRRAPSLFVVEPHYFATLGASLDRGRGLTAEDARSAARVAVINRALAADYWPDVDPIGQCVRVSGLTPCTYIVGIVENILLYDRVNTSRTQLYVAPTHPDTRGPRPRALLIRSAADDARPLAPVVREALQSLTPDMPYVAVATMEERAARQLQPWRLGTTMFVLFGGMALAIAAVGLFGAMMQTVTQRRHEIGIRMALGATAGRVIVQIVRHGAITIAAGAAAGLLLAGGATRFLGDLLYQTSPRDPLVFTAVAGVLLIAGIVAAVLPARRSASIDPLIVLKAD